MPTMKIGKMGISSILCGSWFMLMVLHSSVYCDTERSKLGSGKNVEDPGDRGKQDMQSLKIGRKFGFPSEFNIGNPLGSLIKLNEREESLQLDMVAHRRLLEDNATKSVITEEKMQESAKNQTNSEIKDEKQVEKPLPREMRANSGNIKLKENENLEIVEKQMHNNTGENSNADEFANKDTEENKSIGVETPTNSTETGKRKMESIEAQASANRTNVETKNSTNIEIQKIENGVKPAESWANSTDAETLKMEGSAAKSSPNSTEIQAIHNSTGIEVQRMESAEANRTDIKTEAPESSQADTPLPNSTDVGFQKTESIPSEGVKASANPTNSETQIIQKNPSQSSADFTELQTANSETQIIQKNASQNSANFTEIETANSERAEEDETLANRTDVETQNPDDENDDFMQEFADLPSKLQETAEKVADKLLPGIQKLSNTSKEYFNIANEGIAQKFSPVVGKQYAPFVASAITCVFLLLPMVVAIAVFEQIRTFFPLQKVIFLANIYLANYFATLAVASFILGMEPMQFFYRNSLSGYICLQLLGGLGYIIYLFLQCFNVVVSCSNGRILGRLGAVIQCVVALCVGLHYYVTVFHKAVAHKPPRTCWKVHATYALLFLILCLLSKANYRNAKKAYLHDGDTDKKN